MDVSAFICRYKKQTSLVHVMLFVNRSLVKDNGHSLLIQVQRNEGVIADNTLFTLGFYHSTFWMIEVYNYNLIFNWVN